MFICSNDRNNNKLLYNGLFRCSLVLFALIFCVASHANIDEQAIDKELRQLLKNTIAAADSFGDQYDAEVWLVAMSEKLKHYIKDPEQRMNLLRHVHREATRAELQPELVLAVIQIESAFDPYAVSRVGAQGIMQVMPFWKKEIGRPQDSLIDLVTNLKYGCTILKYYIDKENGGLANALARYNGSYGSYVYTRKVMNAWIERWR